MPQEKCLKRLLRLNILLKLYCYPSNHPLKDEIQFNHDKIKIKIKKSKKSKKVKKQVNGIIYL